MRTMRSTVIALACGAALALGACTTPNEQATTTTSKKAPEAGVSKGLGSKEATGDIKLGRLSFDSLGLPHAVVTITNRTSKRSDTTWKSRCSTARGW
jgi:hypothetical protein